MTELPKFTDMSITEKGKELLGDDNHPLNDTPLKKLTLEIIARMPGLDSNQVLRFVNALGRAFGSVEEALAQVQMGILEEIAKEVTRKDK